MLIPLYDHNPVDKTPVVTYGLIGLNVLAWLGLQGMGINPMFTESICKFGLISGNLLGSIPDIDGVWLSRTYLCRFDGSPDFHTLITSMFMHGNWLHLIGNMWFLWIFGDNVENALGRVKFVIFYLVCGLAASATQIATDAQSVVPMVGASGAIGGIMGAYIVLHPRARVKSLLFLLFFITVIEVPALVILGIWFLSQLISGLPQLGAASEGGVAFWAHIGGFVAGAGLIYLLKPKSPVFTLRR